MEVSPFDMEASRLVNLFMNACAQAGVSTSGLCIDIMAGSYLREAHLLKAAVLARIEGITPPFKAGDKVKVSKDRCVSVPAEGWKGCRITEEKIQTVSGIFYQGEGRWLLDFKEIPYKTGSLSNVQYAAKYFEKTNKE